MRTLLKYRRCERALYWTYRNIVFKDLKKYIFNKLLLKRSFGASGKIASEASKCKKWHSAQPYFTQC